VLKRRHLNFPYRDRSVDAKCRLDNRRRPFEGGACESLAPSTVMGKRSSFERRWGDFYPTPRSAVLPLIPHLRGVRTFAEPWCGDGALVRISNPSGYAASMRATSRTARMRLRSTITARSMRSSRIRPSAAS